MRKSIVLACVVSLLAVVLSGCGGGEIKKDAIAQIKKVGILSISVQKVPGMPSNDEVTQAVANYALKATEFSMKKITSFKVIPVATYYKNPDYAYAGTMAKAAGVQAFLKQKADSEPNFAAGAAMVGATDAASALKAYMSGGQMDNNTAMAKFSELFQKKIDSHKEVLVGAAGMPFLPYSIFTDVNDNSIKTTVSYGNAQPKDEEAVFKDVIKADVAAVCKKLGLDAMAMVFVYTEVPGIGNLHVISNGRIMGRIKMDMTMLLIDKNGDIVADLGMRVMDDLAPSKMALPTHKILSYNGKMVGKAEADLKDPKGEIQKAMTELTAVSAKRMVADFRKAIGEVE